LFIFLDTETTGTEKDDRLCQLAFKLESGEIVNKLFKPPLPIAIEPMSVHHITNEMVADKPTFKGGHDHQKLVALLNDDKNIRIYLLPTIPNLMLTCLLKRVSIL